MTHILEELDVYLNLYEEGTEELGVHHGRFV
jgi:hypothetical protein